MTSKTLSLNVTTLDLIKTFAVICMILDHMGLYFFPDSPWFRVVGRLGGAPIWFFLIGYASSRSIPNSWMIGALVLAVADFVLMGHVFAFNVLVTLIMLRLLIDPIMAGVMRTRYLFWLAVILLTFFYIPTNMITEYGTLAILCGIFGYITRHRKKIERFTFFTKTDYHLLIAAVIGVNTVMQASVFGFDMTQSGFLAVALAGITIALSKLKIEDVPQITGQMSSSVLKFCGRKSLEIYVGHLLVFKVVFWVFYLMGFYQ